MFIKKVKHNTDESTAYSIQYGTTEENGETAGSTNMSQKCTAHSGLVGYNVLQQCFNFSRVGRIVANVSGKCI